MGSPRIGITCDLKLRGIPESRSKQEIHFLKGDYVRAVLSAGGLPILVPAQEDLEAAPEVLDALDGLLISGAGDDLEPSLYGEEVLPACGPLNPKRGRFELALAREAMARDLPLLGICGGTQVLNVAAGGSLYQDIPSQIAGSLPHRPEGEADFTYHGAEVESGSFLAELMGAARVRVNSYHHQSVKGVGRGFRVSARAEDGVVEAIEGEGEARFLLGVQWHPEALFDEEESSARILRRFVEAAHPTSSLRSR
ncbi:MAG: gamma-glutamyl-gamma-aminobutyrate hydrolase family protein [Nitrospinota bacterium]